MACYACGRGFYDECINPDENGNPCSQNEVELKNDLLRDGEDNPFDKKTDGLAWQKDDNDVTDNKSTGRKRAAVLYPLDREAPCEWQKLKFSGGAKPIVGCVNGFQRQRHHGPNKDTLDNSSGNVHRVCDNCHGRWHTVNDEGYDWNASEYAPHDKTTVATEKELADNEIYWAMRKAKAPGGGRVVHD